LALGRKRRPNQFQKVKTMEKTTNAAAVKTHGQFVITSKLDPTFSYSGYSCQCEIVYRDYLGWCTKAKAPKTLQAFYNAHKTVDGKTVEPATVFSLKVVPMNDADFAKATAKKPVDATAKVDALLAKLFEAVGNDPTLNARIGKAVGDFRATHPVAKVEKK
jgi:hypothetical protein